MRKSRVVTISLASIALLVPCAQTAGAQTPSSQQPPMSEQPGARTPSAGTPNTMPDATMPTKVDDKQFWRMRRSAE